MEEKQDQNIELNDIIHALKKNFEDRNAIEIEKLQQQTKDIPFFKQYISQGDKDVHYKCCKYMKYEYAKKDETIFLIDTIGTKFYLILKGKVGVYIRLPKQVNIQNQDSPEKKQEEDDSLTCVKVLNQGEAFGELALLNNKPRLASIIAHENTYLAVLDKKEFGIILKEKEEQKLLKEMGFFAKLPFFNGWNFNLVKLLYLNAFRVKYKKGDIVFQEGQEPVAVYIITEGQFDLEKTFDKEKRLEFWESENTNQIKNMRLASKKAKMNLRIASYVPHELFGEEDIMNQNNKRTFSAICESATGECIMIKKRDFFIRILKEEGAKQYLKQRLQNKNNRMMEKIKNIRNSIYGFQNFLYNDQDGLKKQKEQNQEIFKNENFSQDAIKKFVNNQVHPSNFQADKDQHPKESPSPTEVGSPDNFLSPQKQPYSRRSMTTFMNLFTNNQTEQNSPIIPIFEYKRQSLAANTEQFSPLLKQIKQQQNNGENKNILRLFSNSNQNGEIQSPSKNQMDMLEKDYVRTNKKNFTSQPNSNQASLVYIKKFSAVFDEEKFNNFRLSLKRNKSQNNHFNGSDQSKHQNTNQSNDVNSYSLIDLPEMTQQNSKLNVQNQDCDQKTSVNSIPVITQTIVESKNPNDSSYSSDEDSSGRQSCLSPSSPQFKKYILNSSQKETNMQTNSNNENKSKVNLLMNHNSDYPEANKFSSMPNVSANKMQQQQIQKIKIFENLKQKMVSQDSLTHLNIYSEDNRLSKDESKIQLEENKQHTQSKNNSIILPKIIINSDQNHQDKSIITPTTNKIKSFASEEISQYKIITPNNKKYIHSDQFQQTTTITDRQKITQSVGRIKQSSLYFNQVFKANTENQLNKNIRQNISLDRQAQNIQYGKKQIQQNTTNQIAQNINSNGSVGSPSKKNKQKGWNQNKPNSEQNNLYNKQHIQAGQRIGDLIERMIMKQQEKSQRTLETLHNNSQISKFEETHKQNLFSNSLLQKSYLKSNPSATKLISTSKDDVQNSLFNQLKHHISIGTQFSSLIKQIDQNKVQKIPQNSLQNKILQNLQQNKN
ncbi:hypothetical protein ABPG74_006546 [Tetrahymena malaccensis]